MSQNGLCESDFPVPAVHYGTSLKSKPVLIRRGILETSYRQLTKSVVLVLILFRKCALFRV